MDGISLKLSFQVLGSSGLLDDARESLESLTDVSKIGRDISGVALISIVDQF